MTSDRWGVQRAKLSKMADSLWQIYNLVVLYVQLLQVNEPAEFGWQLAELIVAQE